MRKLPQIGLPRSKQLGKPERPKWLRSKPHESRLPAKLKLPQIKLHKMQQPLKPTERQ